MRVGDSFKWMNEESNVIQIALCVGIGKQK